MLKDIGQVVVYSCAISANCSGTKMVMKIVLILFVTFLETFWSLEYATHIQSQTSMSPARKIEAGMARRETTKVQGAGTPGDMVGLAALH